MQMIQETDFGLEHSFSVAQNFKMRKSKTRKTAATKDGPEISRLYSVKYFLFYSFTFFSASLLYIHRMFLFLPD